MFGLGTTHGYHVERALAVGAFLGLAVGLALASLVPGNARRCPHHAAPAVSESAAVERAPAVTTLELARARADRLYRNKQFVDAAGVISELFVLAHDGSPLKLRGDTGSVDPESDAIDLRNLASQYYSLGSMYRAMDPATDATDAFWSLKDAWKLDLALGGVHADEIRARLTEVAPDAAREYLRRGDREHAVLPLSTADALGVPLADR
jgi:hypothetical protein